METFYTLNLVNFYFLNWKIHEGFCFWGSALKMFNNKSFLLAQMSLHAHLGIFFVVPDHSPPFLCHCFWRTCTCFIRESKRAEEGWLNQYLAKVKKVKVLVTQMYLTLCDPMDCSPPGSSLQGILQARTLEWIVIPFSRDWTQVSCIVGRLFTNWATKEALSINIYSLN